MKKPGKTVLIAALVWSILTACLFAMALASGRSVLAGAFQGWLLAHAGPFAMLIYPYESGYGTFWLTLLVASGLIGLGFCARVCRKLFSVLGVSVWFLSGWAVILTGY